MRFSEEAMRRLMRILDLTEYEARLYLTLLELGPLTVSRASKASGIPRPRCYDVLRSLHSKGLISLILSKPMKCQAQPLEIAFDNRLMQLRKELERKEREAEALKRDIEASLEEEVRGRKFRVIFLEDRGSIVASMMRDSTNAREEILTAMSRSPATHSWEEYIEEYKRALERGVLFKFLVPSRGQFLNKAIRMRDFERYLKSGQIEVQSTHLIYQPFSVIDRKITYIYLTDPLRREFLLAIRIEDEVFAEHMRSMFELLWNQAQG